MPTSRASSREPLLRPQSPPRSRSRPARGHAATGSLPLLPAPEELLVPGASASLNEEEVELIGELVHPHHHHHAAEETLVGGDGEGGADGAYPVERDMEWTQDRPWWRRPSPWW